MVINSDAEDLAAVAKGIQHVVELTQSKSSRLTSEASCGDQMLYGEDVSSGSSQKQQEGVPDGRDSCLHVNGGGADQFGKQLSNAEVAVAVLEAVESVPEPVGLTEPIEVVIEATVVKDLAVVTMEPVGEVIEAVTLQAAPVEVPVKEMKEMEVVPKFQHRSAATVGVSPQQRDCSTRAAVENDVINSQRHVPGDVRPKIQPRDDVTDLPQVEVGGPTPADGDVMVAAAVEHQELDFMHALIENMARDMGIQGIHGGIFDDCPVFA